jgi:uncharacterized membrane protein YagU involved in acid resistance
MSMDQETTTRDLEREADEAREKVARDVGALQRGSKRAVRRAAHVTKRSSILLPALAVAIGLASTPRPRRRRQSHRYLANGGIGLLAGIGAGIAMNQVFKIWRAFEKRMPPAEAARGAGLGEEPATVKTAEGILGPLPAEEKPIAGSLTHYAFSGLLGAIYGAASAVEPRIRAGHGLAYGAVVWLFADELALPLLRLGSWRAPLVTHVRGLVAHLVYGASVDAFMRIAQSRLRLR